MSLAARLRGLWPGFDPRSPREIEDEIAAELEFHLAEATAEWLAKGLDPLAARARAVEQFGDVQKIRAQCRRAQLGGRDMLVKVLVGVIVALVLAMLGMGAMLWTMRTRALVAMEMALREREAAQHASAEAQAALLSAIELQRAAEAERGALETVRDK